MGMSPSSPPFRKHLSVQTHLYLTNIMYKLAVALLLVSLSMAHAFVGGYGAVGGVGGFGVGGHSTTVVQHRKHLPVAFPVMKAVPVVKGFGGYGLGGIGGYGLGAFGGYGGYGLGGFGGYGLGGFGGYGVGVGGYY